MDSAFMHRDYNYFLRCGQAEKDILNDFMSILHPRISLRHLGVESPFGIGAGQFKIFLRMDMVGVFRGRVEGTDYFGRGSKH